MSRVLIVDDEEEIRYVLSEALGSGYDLRLANDGAAALECLEQALPDLVITDLHMPGLSGLELLAAVHERDPHLPVMIVTGSGSLDSAVEALRLGAYDYILKPIEDLGIIRNLVRRALESRALKEENARLIDDLQQANAFKGQLLRTVSHDYKNLLTVVMGYGRLAQISPEPEQISESLDRILTTARLMALMAEDLSTYGQIDSHALHLDRENVSLLECAQNAAAAVLVDPELHHLAIPDDDVEAFADRYRTTQILTNLLNNAVKYAPRGGEIRVTLAADTDAVRVSVKDQGLGIPADKADRLFDPFYRLDRDQMAGTPGTGLGLTIVKNLVELQGGRIWCESQEGQGATFHFTLPRAKP